MDEYEADELPAGTNTCRKCGDMVQEPGDRYCGGDICLWACQPEPSDDD